MTTIAVRGDATIHHPAERGTVRIAVGFTGADRPTVVRSTTTLHRFVTEAARAHREAGAATWWGADQVRVSPYREYRKNSDVTVLRYRADASVEVKFRDFAVLAEWATDLAEREGITIAGITWALTEALRVDLERRARADAVRHAGTKASDYARAFGAGTPTLLALWEPGLRPSEESSVGGSPMSARMAAAPSGGGSVELAPEDIAVSASITADYTV